MKVVTMRKSVIFLFIIIISTVLNGCILSKSPNANSVSVPIGENRTFTLSVFPPNATFDWTLDDTPVIGQGKSYQYTATVGEHSLKVTATHFLGTDKQTWTITDAAVKPRGGRLLGIDITKSQSGTYDDAINLAKSVGIDFVALTLNWDMIETSPGVYDDTWLDVANLYYPAQGVKLALILSTIATVADCRPADLRLLAWNDTTVVQRYEKLIDHVLSRLPAVNLMSLSIGSEVDIFLGTNTVKWTEYTDFYNQTLVYVKTKVSAQTTVGVKTTFDGTVTNRTAQVQTLNANSETIFITYYPLNADFTVKNPDVVSADFASLIALYPGRKILFLEIGYPSGTLCASSEELQRRFVENVFSAWDEHDDVVAAVNFVWLHDLSQSEVDWYAEFFGIFDPRFKEYLKTLGLHYSNGSEKTAFGELAIQAEARGW
jgi:hypothetical protein